MNQRVVDVVSAETSAARSEMFKRIAAEIAQIDGPNSGKLNQGLIASLHGIIDREVRCDLKTFQRRDERFLSLLKEAVESAYDVRIRNSCHLYNFLRERLPRFKKIPHMKENERGQAAALCTNLSKKLVNGHTGSWI